MRSICFPNVSGKMCSKTPMATLLVVSCVLLISTEMCWGLKISAFNIQTFGPTKMGKPDVLNTLVQVRHYIAPGRFMLTMHTSFLYPQIVKRYDIALLQEIRDTSATNVIEPFLAKVNRLAQNVIIYIYMDQQHHHYIHVHFCIHTIRPFILCLEKRPCINRVYISQLSS